ncbi:hypothetical protein BT63DRAFT_1325 [Microthyrium microscopicum]|uniref:Uncharacterized protein n=1 Tax=Microthyrium microscopicum TaxID=703497 RepID=A0A6A6UP50_9PEZI|nr:hypothetical protein BT63DRAFT_1325 [Microthyrium microscopicum]
MAGSAALWLSRSFMWDICWLRSEPMDSPGVAKAFWKVRTVWFCIKWEPFCILAGWWLVVASYVSEWRLACLWRNTLFVNIFSSEIDGCMAIFGEVVYNLRTCDMLRSLDMS